MIKYFFLKAPEYQKWIDEQPLKSRTQIGKRLSNIETEGHFGDFKSLEDDVWELRWVNGRRLYYAHAREKNIILLLGGNKNGQSKDIVKAKRILKKHSITEA